LGLGLVRVRVNLRVSEQVAKYLMDVCDAAA